jgi:predicted PurR-regulated permease PerM
MPVSLDDMNFATGIAILIAIIAIVISPLALIIAGIIYGIQERKKRIKKEFIMTPEMESEVNDLLDEGIYESKEEAEQLVKQTEQWSQQVKMSLKGEKYNYWGWFRIIITIAASAFTALYIIFYIITLFL